jgi:hypothetical protein
MRLQGRSSHFRGDYLYFKKLVTVGDRLQNYTEGFAAICISKVLILLIGKELSKVGGRRRD